MNYAKPLEIQEILKNALEEDIGTGDVTTATLIPQGKVVKAIILAKEDCLICGLGVACTLIKIRDKKIKFRPLVKDGLQVKAGTQIVSLYGKATSILTVERVVLNFLAHLSGIATLTRAFVDKIKPYKARILDTRKTTPGLRLLEKYAVRTGGGFNHRLRLDEMILVKDNHFKVLGLSGYRVLGLKDILGKNKKNISKRRNLEIEVKNIQEFEGALKIKPDIIMLDNMGISDIKKAVRIRNRQYSAGNTKLEVSGNVTLQNVRSIASCGVEMISVGALTHSAPSVDISLEIL